MNEGVSWYWMAIICYQICDIHNPPNPRIWWSTHRSDVQAQRPSFLWRSGEWKARLCCEPLWPRLQVIKALSSFCQSSDSPNISPWLISAVSSVRVYTELKGSTASLCVHYTLDQSLLQNSDPDPLWYHPFGPVACVAPQTYHPGFYQGIMREQGGESLPSTPTESWEFYCAPWWASCDLVKWCFSSDHPHFGCQGLTPPNTASQPSDIT